MTFSELSVSKGLLVYVLVLAFITGSVLGSFINCFAWRIVHHEKITRGRSHCAVCGHTLGALDLIPVFSYIFLKGRCRYCHEKISPRYFLVETALGLLFVSAVCVQGVTFNTLVTMAVMTICAIATMAKMKPRGNRPMSAQTRPAIERPNGVSDAFCCGGCV